MEESIFETLTSRGWNFKDPEEIKALIRSKNPSSSSSAEAAVESELLNMDLRSFGGKSLPDPSSMKKSSYLSGPKVLQLVSLRDICQSNIDASLKNSQRHHRLLQFGLTDGHSEVTAIEYIPIPSITEDIIPGTKVRLGNKIPIHNGILCLNPQVVSIMGGLVQSLHEEWQMSQKYSGFSRASLRLSQNENGVGPPPFEKLQIEARPSHVAQSHSSHESTLKYSSHNNDGRRAEGNQGHQVVTRSQHSNDSKAVKVIDDPKVVPSIEKTEDKPCSSETRPKQESEAVPVQNQAAAQKLLAKMTQPTHGERHPRGQKHRFKGKQEEPQVFTLEEWERRKGSNLKPTITNEMLDVSQDEELARRLQKQLDMEDFNVKPEYAEAEQIAEQLRMSMFSFGGTEERNDSRRESRGRGRGRGRGRRRFG